MSVKDRYFKVVDYKRQKKGPLTEKQYLVYAYLLSMSKWNPTEYHYYIYKNSFLVKDACQFIGISQPTWRKALEKLQEKGYIHIDINKKYYIIYFDVSWAKLDIALIKFLVEQSKFLRDDFGGILPSLYGIICRYWVIQSNANDDCIINLSSLNNLFFSDRTKEHLQGIWMMLQLFKSLKLIYFTEIPLKNSIGKDYVGYKIIKVESKLPKKLIDLQDNLEIEENNSVENIIKKILDNKNSFESFYNHVYDIKDFETANENVLTEEERKAIIQISKEQYPDAFI